MRNSRPRWFRPCSVPVRRTRPFPAFAWVPAVLLLLVAGCGEELPPAEFAEAEAVQVRDSAGVVIVTNRSPAWPEGRGWTIEPNPEVVVGVLEGEQPYVFQGIGSAGRLSDGRIFLVESGSREIRIYDAHGRHERSLGGAGAGPGEFLGAPLVAATAGDTLLALDQGSPPIGRGPGRYSWISPDDGGVGRTMGFGFGGVQELTGRPALQWPTFLPDGSIFFRHEERELVRRPAGQAGAAGPLPRDGGARRSYSFILVAPGGEDALRIEDEAAGPVELRGGSGDSWTPSGGGAAAAHGAPPRVHLSTRGEWEVHTFAEDGRLVRIVRLERSRRPFPPDAEFPDNQGPRPDSLPAFTSILISTDGHLWLREPAGRADGTLRYTVLDPDGRWLGSVESPQLGAIREVGDDYLLTVSTDEFRVQYLHLHRIEGRERR